MVVRVCVELKIPSLLADCKGAMTAAQLASATGAEQLLIGQTTEKDWNSSSINQFVRRTLYACRDRLELRH